MKVTDSGIGVGGLDQLEVFTKLPHRLGPQGGHSGVGLGLVSINPIVEAHSGPNSLESELRVGRRSGGAALSTRSVGRGSGKVSLLSGYSTTVMRLAVRAEQGSRLDDSFSAACTLAGAGGNLPVH